MLVKEIKLFLCFIVLVKIIFAIQVDRTGKNRRVVPVKVKKTKTSQTMIYGQIVDCLTTGQIPDPEV